ncbi:MAG: helix-turn-helix domain-containing protein [Candidatus Hodarchaeota archaeon]
MLNKNLTLTEISNLTGIARSNVHRVIRDFRTHGLIEDITPNINRGRFYKITALGLEFKLEFEEHIIFHKRIDKLLYSS